MELYIIDKKIVDNSLIRKTEYIVNHLEFLASHIIENKIMHLFFKYRYGNNMHEHRHSKRNGPDKFVLSFS